jgi:dihydrofolate reductase
MKISIIVAVAKNNVIGSKGKLLWHITGDLSRFKQITMGHHILMGETTYKSIGKVLQGRTNLILSFDENFKVQGAFVFKNPEEAIKFADMRGEKELMIIGGGMIYKYFFPIAEKIYLTKVLKNYKGDVKFPEINNNEWNETYNEPHTDSYLPFEYKILERK